MRQKPKFEQIGPKIRTSDLLEYLHSRHFAGAESYRDATIFCLKPKFGQISPKTKILFGLLENLHTSRFEDYKKIWKQYIEISHPK